MVLEYPAQRVLSKMHLREITVTEMPAYLQTAGSRSAYYDAPNAEVTPRHGS